jgi:hypothetical protein
MMNQYRFLMEFFIGQRVAVSEELRHMKIYQHPSFSNDYDFVTVIPKMSRNEHLRILLETYKISIKESPYRHIAIVVEHSESQDGRGICEQENIPYVFIQKNNGKLFNKCLCMNVGSAIYETKYLMFHDIDLVIPKNFWTKLEKNIGNRKILQSFANRRVHYVHKAQTEMVFARKLDPDTLYDNPRFYKSGKSGAPGGSVIIEKNLFEKIGGFDPYYFLAYSIEDQFFVDKASLFCDFDGCNNPPIEMVHLWHPENITQTPEVIRNKGHKIHEYFNSIDKSLKMKLINEFASYYKIQKNTVKECLKNASS